MQPYYRGQFIARADSGITTLADLEGKTFCFVDPNSTSGYIVPNIILKANGIDADAVAVRAFSASGLQFLVSSSFSKSFSLYGERVGALSIVTAGKDESARVMSQLKRVIRTNYSNPPIHGGALVATVLASAELRQMWETELAGMRDRIRAMRTGLVDAIKAQGVAQDFSFVIAQRGMFSYTGLTAAQVERMKDEFGIYAVSTGRICLAALNTKNVDYVAKAIATVTKT